MGRTPNHIIVIGGSSGSLPIIKEILEKLTKPFPCTITIVVHRLRNVPSDLSKVIVQKKAFKLHEPEDKDLIVNGNVYLAPANYHLLFEDKESFCLDYSEPVWYSRPSIDVTFSSAAKAFGKNTLAILLTGANADGAEGCNMVLKNGGTVLVQDPEQSAFDAMPKAAIQRNKNCTVCSVEEIIEKTQSFINKIA